MQTAVNYLLKAFEGAYGKKVGNVISVQIEQAKEMEKQQKGFSLSDMQNCWGIAYMNGVCEDNELHENMSFPDLIDSIIKSKEL